MWPEKNDNGKGDIPRGRLKRERNIEGGTSVIAFRPMIQCAS